MGDASIVKVPPRESKVWKTPLFDQYWKLKEKAPGALLFFRLGDFYELFGQDAVLSAPVMGVQLTSRDKRSECPLPMCGVPAHSWERYAEKLLAEGFSLALAEQENLEGSLPKGRKIVERYLTRVITPGLPIHLESLDAKADHWLCTLSLTEEQTYEFILLDFLSSKKLEGKLTSQDELNAFLKLYDCAEILLHKEQEKDFEFLSRFPVVNFCHASEKSSRVLLRDYLSFTQRWTSDKCEAFLDQLLEYKNESLRESSSLYAKVDAQVLEQWNVFPELADLLDSSATSMGSRFLRKIFTDPFYRPSCIMNRQSFLKKVSASEFLQNYFNKARGIYDIERLMGRFRIGVARPQELLKFSFSFKKISDVFLDMDSDLYEVFSCSLKDIHLSIEGAQRKSLEEFRSVLSQALNLDADLLKSAKYSDLISEGYDSTLDALKKINEATQQWLQEYETELRDTTKIPSLKIRYNKVFGFYIEVTKTHSSKVPSSFERKQTMVNAERFTTESLKNKEEEILSSQSRLESRAEEILLKLQKELMDLDSSIQNHVQCFSYLDALLGVALSVQRLERRGAWVFPDLREKQGFFVDLVESRHPLVEVKEGGFVPNSLSLGLRERMLLLTGPNMAGKSTLMRQVGISLLLAQYGFPVPAEQMTFAPSSGFFSRMGASDKILEGESTFMVEMKEAAYILQHASEESFVLVDEIGRGTSTQDGRAIAKALLDHLFLKSQARVIFATHFHELSNHGHDSELCKNVSMEIQMWEGKLIFLRKLVSKPAESSYGIEVAELAGLPRELIKNAKSYCAKSQELALSHGRGKSMDKEEGRVEELPLFQEIRSPLSLWDERFKEIVWDDLSPKAAFDLLYEWKDQV